MRVAKALVLFVSGAGSITCTPNQDALASLHQWFLNRASGLTEAMFWTFVRAAFLLILQIIAASAIFANARKSSSHGVLMTIQWAVCLLAFLVVMEIPLNGILLGRTEKGWILAISIFAIAVLPWRLSWLLCPREGQRRITAVAIYTLLGLLLLIQIFLR